MVVRETFELRRFPRRLRCAGRGPVVLVRRTPAARIHLVATAVAVGLGARLRSACAERLWIVIAVAAAWTVEAFNGPSKTW